MALELINHRINSNWKSTSSYVSVFMLLYVLSLKFHWYQGWTSDLHLFAEELINNAALIGTPGKGILEADESNRKGIRELLFPARGALRCFSGVILSEETLDHGKTRDGKPFDQVLMERGILPGIKVDVGTQSPEALARRCHDYYEKGARFVERTGSLDISSTERLANLKFGPAEPFQLEIDLNANELARYAIICQQNGLVPILEPEIPARGRYDIERRAGFTERVLAATYKALHDHDVLLEGTLLKTNMVTPLSRSVRVAPEVVAEYTVRVLQRTVPAAVPAILFFSGGRSKAEEKATLNLNAVNKLEGKKPWSLSFSFGDSLQPSMVKAGAGKKENFEQARADFLARCKAKSKAALGEYEG